MSCKFTVQNKEDLGKDVHFGIPWQRIAIKFQFENEKGGLVAKAEVNGYKNNENNNDYSF